MSYLANRTISDLHISASDMQCVRHVRAKLRKVFIKEPKTRQLRKDFYKECLEAHRNHQNVMSSVLGGS